MSTDKTTWTQDQLVTEAARRFGKNPLNWAFKCPNCSDIATAQDFKNASADPNRIGQECIGRPLGALKGSPTNDSGKSIAERGCDWAAYGLFSGPWFIQLPDGKKVPSFPLAPAVKS